MLVAQTVKLHFCETEYKAVRNVYFSAFQFIIESKIGNLRTRNIISNLLFTSSFIFINTQLGNMKDPKTTGHPWFENLNKVKKKKLYTNKTKKNPKKKFEIMKIIDRFFTKSKDKKKVRCILRSYIRKIYSILSIYTFKKWKNKEVIKRKINKSKIKQSRKLEMKKKEIKFTC